MLLLSILLLAGLAVLLFLTTLQMLYKKQTDSVFRLRLAGVSPAQLTAAAVLQATMALAILIPAGVLFGGLGALAADRWVSAGRIPYFQVRVDPVLAAGDGCGDSRSFYSGVLPPPGAPPAVSTVGRECGHLPDRPNRSARKRERTEEFPPRSPLFGMSGSAIPILFWARRSFQGKQVRSRGSGFFVGLGLAVLLISSYVIAILHF